MLTEALLDAAAVRLIATAIVIIGVTWSVKLFGPLIGGVLAGLPITLGPGFYFLVGEAPPGFVARTASYALLSLCATQSFLPAYILLARRRSPLIALGGGIATWVLIAFLLHFLPSPLWLGLLLFVGTTCLSLRLSSRALLPVKLLGSKTGWGSLLLRGVLAGILVAGVTTQSHRLGATTSGILLSFPIGFSVISFTLHQQMGKAVAMATLHSAILGTASLAGFCIALTLAIPHLSPYAAMGIALLTSFAVTFALLLQRRAQPRSHPTSSQG
ncbi:MAG TPA: hypothetical protein VF285_05685 [Castellaniella sp.]|uniref:hypothetical protein n=1 Tax=Castellaniella sp. TaxID=1955812 RepID=UPI002F129721